MTNQLEKEDGNIYAQAAGKIRENYNYGDVVPTEYIMELLGDPKPKDNDTAKAFEQWQLRRMTHIGNIGMILLEQYKVCLSNVRGVGYMLVEPQNQADYALNRTTSKMSDALSDGSKIVANININLLSDVERNHAQAVENQLTILNSMMAKHIEKAEKIARILSE